MLSVILYFNDIPALAVRALSSGKSLVPFPPQAILEFHNLLADWTNVVLSF